MATQTETTTEQVKTVAELVRRAENNYVNGTTAISKYVDFSLYETIEKIDAYLNSKHTSGELDSLNREKPFFNIVTAAVNIWYRATDIDRKDMKIKATRSGDTLAAFLATAVLQDWMKRENFGQFLNEWGRSLARYGSTIVKFVVKGGTLYPMVMPWNRMIVDTVAFDDSIKIEILELNEAQLRQQKGYDPEMVDSLCNALSARQNQNRQRKDNLNDFIRLYEVHGLLPVANLKQAKGEEYTADDCDTYVAADARDLVRSWQEPGPFRRFYAHGRPPRARTRTCSRTSSRRTAARSASAPSSTCSKRSGWSITPPRRSKISST